MSEKPINLDNNQPIESQSITSGLSNRDVLDSVLRKSEEELIPWEDCILPSRGIYYDGLIPEGLIKVRAMGIHADKILSTQRLAKSGASIDWLFDHCVKLPQECDNNGFTHQDLLTGDRTFLIYYLRGITHGNEYEFVVKCPECDLSQIQTYNLNELSETMQGPDQSLGLEPFKISLPYLSQKTNTDFWVKIRFLRGEDIQAMLGTVSSIKPRQGPRNRRKQQPDQVKTRGQSIDETLENNLNLVIVEAMDETDRTKIQALVGNMHSSDIAAIREFLKDKAPGIDTMIETNCEGCGNLMVLDLPITESFFRPARLGHD